jgi:hypothetical protein
MKFTHRATFKEGVMSEIATVFLNLLCTEMSELEAAFDLMEGDGFFKSSATDGGSRHSIKAALGRLQNHFREIEESDLTPEEVEDENRYWCHVIYGNGGWHRYMVRGDGTIEFSAHHAHWPKENKIRDAESLGFRILR